jgi:AraC-like DNA-binding protein
MCEICGNPHFDFRYVSRELQDYIRNDITHHPLRPGMQVNIRNHRAHTGLTEEWEVHSRTFMLDFVASGDTTCRLKGESTGIDKTAGFSGFCYIHGQTQKVVYRSDNPVKWVGIVVDLPVMEELVRDGAHRVTRAFDRLLHMDRAAEPLCLTTQSSPQIQAIIQQLFACPYQGELRRLFVESKALELMFLRLSEQVVEPRRPSDNLTTADRDKVFHARRILLASIDQPPGLQTLARHVGMSETKLKQSFKQVFGQPVFEYLRRHRLAVAYDMLINREWNVSEAAIQVGYSSLSHFSQVFRNHFGVSPSEVAQGKARR